MPKLFKRIKSKDGQALLLAALLMTVLMGFAALVIDIGTVSYTKADLQDAADAAALAGAQDLPNIAIAKNTATYYAVQNGVQASEVKTITPFNGDATKIEVICTRKVPYAFARVLGLTGTEVSVRAVAKKNSQWAGEALPFVNLDDDYEEDPEIVAWEKVGPGDFESIDNYEIMNPGDPDTLYFKADYLNGIEIKKGTVATIKQEVGYVYDQHKLNKSVYVLSLFRDIINSGQVKLKDGTVRSLNKLKNNDVIDPSQLVLLECIFHDYDYQGKTLYLTFQKVYDIAHNEFPPDYISPDGGSPQLME